MPTAVVAFFANLAGLVAFGTFGFFVFLFLVAIANTTAVRFKKGNLATLTLVVTVLAVHFISGLNIFNAIKDHWAWFIFGAIAFLVVGGGVSLLKTGFEAASIDSRYLAIREEFCTEEGIENGTKIGENFNLNKKFVARLNAEEIDIDEISGRPTFDHRKRRSTIFMWIGHWPFVLLDIFWNDLVWRSIELIYTLLDTKYERIIAGILGKHAGDLETISQRKARLATAGSAPSSNAPSGYGEDDYIRSRHGKHSK